MITDIRNIQVHVNGEMSNEDYHKHEGISSSGLFKLADTCPAKYRYGESSNSPALHFGTASHAAMLEPELFASSFVRDIEKDDHDDIISTVADAKKALQDAGVIMGITAARKALKAESLLTDTDPKAVVKDCKEKLGRDVYLGGTSAKDMYAGVAEFLPDAKVLENMKSALREKFKSCTFVKGSDYDMIIAMRKVLFGVPWIAEPLSEMFYETSVICEVKVEGCDDWIKVKVRPDVITKDRMVPDYKTARDVRDWHFQKAAYDQGYWFRQIFVCDVLAAAYGEKFTPALIAQEKDAPYIPRLFVMDDDDMIASQREHVAAALRQYAYCVKHDSWPGYDDGPVSLGVPAYVK